MELPAVFVFSISSAVYNVLLTGRQADVGLSLILVF